MKINKLGLKWKIENEEKSRQNAENKQTFGLTGKIEKKNEKSRQKAENKQTLGLTGKIKIHEKLVKTPKINKLLV